VVSSFHLKDLMLNLIERFKLIDYMNDVFILVNKDVWMNLLSGVVWYKNNCEKFLSYRMVLEVVLHVLNEKENHTRDISKGVLHFGFLFLLRFKAGSLGQIRFGTTFSSGDVPYLWLLTKFLPIASKSENIHA